MSVIVLASFTAQVNEAEGAFGVFGSGTVEQTVTGSPLEDFDAATTIVATGTGTGAGGGGGTPTDGGASAATAATSRIRWTGSRIGWDGADLHPTATYGEVALEEDMTPGRQTTFHFQTVGHLWAMPTPEDFDDSQPNPGDPAPPAPPPPPAPGDPDTSPKPWGNKPVAAYLSLGQSPRSIVETKVFQGVSLQKSNSGDTAILGDITCVDDSIKYADVPLCYSLEPFGGKRRGEITREMALSVGVPANQISVPVGNLVTKPILLSNGSLLTFLNEFWKGENTWFSFDENGALVGRRVEVKDTPDHTLDAELGDYDLDSFEEVPPTRPPSRYYVKGTIPVDSNGTGTGGPNDGTTTTTDEQSGPYNPKCVKVRPSGQTSYLQANGQYCVNAADTIMVTGRTVTEITTVGGRQSQKVVKTYGWYNPTAYDPNFDTAPPGTSYNGAYGDQTFHRDEAESFMLISTDTTTYSYDVNGTLLHQVDTTEGWYAPHRAGNYAADRVTLTNGNGGYVFPCSTTRIQPMETYQVVSRVDQTYIFNADGYLTRVSTKRYEWYSASASCDIYKDGTPPAVVPPPSSPYGSPCPTGYGSSGGSGSVGGGGVDTSPPTFQPTLTGPSWPGAGNGVAHFTGSAIGIPTGIVDTNNTGYTVVQSLQPGSFVFNSTTQQYDWVASGDTYELTEGPVNASWQPGMLTSAVNVGFSVIPDIPIGLAYVILTVRDNSGVDYFSEPVYFDSRANRFPGNYNLP